MWPSHFVSNFTLLFVWTNVRKNNLHPSCPHYDWQLKTDLDHSTIGDQNISIVNPIVIKNFWSQKKFNCQLCDNQNLIPNPMVMESFRSSFVWWQKTFNRQSCDNQIFFVTTQISIKSIMSLIMWGLKFFWSPYIWWPYVWWPKVHFGFRSFD